MGLVSCPECGNHISEKAVTCPKCGHPREGLSYPSHRAWRGFEYKSSAEILGFPLIHIAFGRNKKTGKLLVARGIIAIGQFAIGLVTIAQFGIGMLFGFGQFVGGVLAVGQVALGLWFGLGQFATGLTAVGQLALGRYVFAQLGFGEYVWSSKIKDPAAVEYFQNLWESVKDFIAR
ncbi:MAG: zinc ribbon domain-containing protein [Candidatus Omnitrophica bacterium]|nr:zinc ribbon domain-containing protein [Candidatus Omnitrophota bacterium]